MPWLCVFRGWRIRGSAADWGSDWGNGPWIRRRSRPRQWRVSTIEETLDAKDGMVPQVVEVHPSNHLPKKA